MATEMHNTTLQAIARYGINLSDIREFAETYNCIIGKINRIHPNGRKYIRSFDTIQTIDKETGLESSITVELGNCPECGEKCASYGWCEGGYHYSTCKCENIDFN